MCSSDLANFKNPFKIIIITEKNKKSPYHHISKYKYNLDIIGFKPWSVRLLELYMSYTVPIRIIIYNKEWKEEPWIQFYERMFKNKLNHVEIKCSINYLKEISDEIINKIKEKCLNIYNILNEHPNMYSTIVNNNSKIINALTDDHVYFYMYHTLKAYNQVIKI